VNVTVLRDRHQRDAHRWTQAGLLDDGEAAAIGLGQQTSADWLLTDDAAGWLFAQALGLEVHGSLGVLLRAAGKEFITPAEARASLDGLANSTLWVCPRIRKDARTALEQWIQ
jgi:predicted nucleic acid-binding protein